MTVEQILERERRWATPVGLAGILSSALVLVSLTVQSGVKLPDSDSEAALLRSVDAHVGALVLGGVIASIGLALMAAPLVYLFRASQARSDKVKPGFIGLAVAGPVFLAVHSIINWLAIGSVATDFLAAGVHHTDKVAKHMLSNSTMVNVALGLKTAGALGLTVSLLYIPLQAMRVGLLTRFWGTLGMLLGPALLLFPFGLYGILVWFLFMGALIGGWWRGPRPPAWETGVAIPWPDPRAARQQASEPAPPDRGGNGSEARGGPGQAGSPRKRKRRR